MAVRHVLLAAVAALGLAGCTSAVAGQAVPAVHPVLRFRPVLVDPSSGAPMILPVTPPSTGAVADPNQAKTIRQNPAVASDPNAQQLAFAALDCAKPDPLHAADDPAKPLVTCDKDGQNKYVLGPSFLDGTAIQSASASYDQQQAQWIVQLTFKPAGAKTWADYTGANVGQQAAFLLDGQVQSAPTINQQITGNTTEISGSFTAQTAEDLAAALNAH